MVAKFLSNLCKFEGTTLKRACYNLSPSALLRSRRHTLCLLLPLIFTAILFRSKIHVTNFRFMRPGVPRPVHVIQQRAYDISSEKYHINCAWTPWHDKRYVEIVNSTSNIFLAMNFFENEPILPTFFQELPILLQHLGPRNVYVSIFENGSGDATPRLLNLMDELLSSMGIAHRIITLGTSDIPSKADGHRIAFLAEARNKALEPLYNGAAARRMRGRKFDEVMFMNDVAHCAVDMMEIIYQKRKQGANQACAVDWGGWGGQVVYDRWVLRTMSGRPFYRWEDMVYYVRAPHPADGKDKPFSKPLLYDEEDRQRFSANLPLQVFSCWNGATVLDAAAFLPPHNIRFRTAKNDPDEHGRPRAITDKASESYLVSVDLWKAKMGKILLVPRSSVSYWAWDYYAYRKDTPLPSSFNDADEMVEWKPEPPSLVAMQDFARWEEAERWGAWNEP